MKNRRWAAAALVLGAACRAAAREGEDPARARERMVREQVEARGVRDPRTLAALRAVERHLFVPPELAELAYADHPLPIGSGQTISQPYIVGVMTEALGLRGGARRPWRSARAGPTRPRSSPLGGPRSTPSRSCPSWRERPAHGSPASDIARCTCARATAGRDGRRRLPSKASWSRPRPQRCPR